MRLHRVVRGCSEPAAVRDMQSGKVLPCTVVRVVTVRESGPCPLLARWWEAEALQDRYEADPESTLWKDSAGPCDPAVRLVKDAPEKRPASAPAGRPGLGVGWERVAAWCPAIGRRSQEPADGAAQDSRTSHEGCTQQRGDIFKLSEGPSHTQGNHHEKGGKWPVLATTRRSWQLCTVGGAVRWCSCRVGQCGGFPEMKQDYHVIHLWLYTQKN